MAMLPTSMVAHCVSFNPTPSENQECQNTTSMVAHMVQGSQQNNSKSTSQANNHAKCENTTSMVAHMVQGSQQSNSKQTPQAKNQAANTTSMVAHMVQASQQNNRKPTSKAADHAADANKYNSKIKGVKQSGWNKTEAAKETGQEESFTSMVAHTVQGVQEVNVNIPTSMVAHMVQGTPAKDSRQSNLNKFQGDMDILPTSMVAHCVTYFGTQQNTRKLTPKSINHAIDANKYDSKIKGVQQSGWTSSNESADKNFRPTQSEIKNNQRNTDRDVRNVTSGQQNREKPKPIEVKIDKEALRREIEQSWDVSSDPELCKVLNKARLLAATKPKVPPKEVKEPKFNISTDTLARMKNPETRIEGCRASLYRNISAFPDKKLSSKQKVELQKLMVKIMGISYMPEDLTGWYEDLSKKNQREQLNLFNRDIFYNTGDVRLREAKNLEKWSEGCGVYLNNYENLLLQINHRDHVKITSAESGHDLRSVLMRLKRTVTKMEESLRTVTNRAFQHKDQTFIHSEQGLGAHGFDLSFIVFYPGFTKEGEKELKNFGIKKGLNVQKYGIRDGVYELKVSQKPEDTIISIIKRGISGVNEMGEEDDKLIAKHKIDMENRHEI